MDGIRFARRLEPTGCGPDAVLPRARADRAKAAGSTLKWPDSCQPRRSTRQPSARRSGSRGRPSGKLALRRPRPTERQRQGSGSAGRQEKGASLVTRSAPVQGGPRGRVSEPGGRTAGRGKSPSGTSAEAPANDHTAGLSKVLARHVAPGTGALGLERHVAARFRVEGDDQSDHFRPRDKLSISRPARLRECRPGHACNL